MPGSLARLDGVSSINEESCGSFVKDARCFAFTFAQQLDHADRGVHGAATFDQRVRLIHRGCSAPTTIADNGYGLPRSYYEFEPSILFETNEIEVEHRFQGNSLPPVANRTWSTLTIENGAADLHSVIRALRPFYPDKWVTTGVSKGGITAVYHRYFYPNDVDGTVAYVAPASRARSDNRYQQYLDSGVFPAECLANVRGFQIGGLDTRRGKFVAELSASLGMSAEVASYYLESYMSSFDWAFWQYNGDCARVPAPTAPDDDHVAYFRAALRSDGIVPAPTDAELSSAATAYEWSWQQGFAQQQGAHVTPFLQMLAGGRGVEAGWRETMPGVPLPAYDGSVTNKVRDWVRDSAERLVLIYGEYDPWSGGALDAPRKPSSFRFFVPKAAHDAAMSGLGGAEAQSAMGAVAAMYGKSMRVASPSDTASVRRRAEAAQLALIEHERVSMRGVLMHNLR